MTDNRTAWGDAMQATASAIERVMTKLDQARGQGDIALSRLVASIDTDVQTARTELSTIAHGYHLEATQADQLAEALRLTAEWSMAIALPGWSWFDALTSYRAHREWDVLPATGLPAGVTEYEAAEPVWSLTRIRETLDDPFCSDHDRAKAMRMLRSHEQREYEVPEAAEECAVVRDLPALGEEPNPVRGVPFLLEQLAALAQESVYLWHTPTRSQPWCVWTGAPAGTGGGEWGAGPTAQDALADAYQRITSAIFAGRVPR